MGSEQWDQWVVKARSVPIEDEIARRGIKLRGKIECCGPCPQCGGTDRFAVNIRKQVFNCRGCGGQGDVIALVKFLDNVDFKGACETLTGEPAPDQKTRITGIKKIVAAEYTYHTADGVIAFVVERVEYQKIDGTFVMKDGKRKKTFRQKRPDPDNPGKWIWNVNGAPIIPYRLPGLLKAIADCQWIAVTEGERCADMLSDLEIPATTNAGGAGNWKPELNPFFAGADLILIPDNDDAGHKHVQGVGAALNGTAARLRVVILPNLPPKGDVVEWLATGGTREALQELIDQAPDWVPIPGADGDGKATAEQSEQELADKINELAQLNPLQYEQRRRDAARELGIRSGALDDEVEARRQRGQIKGPLPFGHWEVEPWPESVDTDVLLLALKRRVRRHVVLSDHACTLVALWIMSAWTHEIAATHSPILRATSAEANSGKTTLLSLIMHLVPRGLLCVEISEAALFRSVELWTPSLIVDEADVILVENEALRAVINSGWTRGATVLRCIGDEKTPHVFPTFCPKALGMKGRKLPDTTLSRCIDVELKRKRPDEVAEHFRSLDDKDLQELRSQALRWSIENGESLKGVEPEMPNGFDNRLGDNFRLILAIADLARGEWPDMAREAARVLTNTIDSASINVRLLIAIKEIFGEVFREAKRTDFIGSGELERKLGADPNSEWAEFKRDKPISQNQIARLLKWFGIAPDHNDEKTARGYHRWKFEDAWGRYVPENDFSKPK
jgi:putative DNA primase/helicase